MERRRKGKRGRRKIKRRKRKRWRKGEEGKRTVGRRKGRDKKIKGEMKEG